MGRIAPFYRNILSSQQEQNIFCSFVSDFLYLNKETIENLNMLTLTLLLIIAYGLTKNIHAVVMLDGARLIQSTVQVLEKLIFTQLRITHFHYRGRIIPSPVLFPILINPVRSLPSYIYDVYFNIILQSTPRYL